MGVKAFYWARGTTMESERSDWRKNGHSGHWVVAICIDAVLTDTGVSIRESVIPLLDPPDNHPESGSAVGLLPPMLQELIYE
jgi:hypothetical protein